MNATSRDRILSRNSTRGKPVSIMGEARSSKEAVEECVDNLEVLQEEDQGQKRGAKD